MLEDRLMKEPGREPFSRSSLEGLRFPVKDGEGEVPVDDAAGEVEEPCRAWPEFTAASVD